MLARQSVPGSRIRAFVGVGLLLAASGAALAAWQAAPGSDGHHVRLVIDYGDGVEKHFTVLPWRKGMTALDAMKLAEASSHGIKVQSRDFGGAGHMIQRIDDLQNEGGRGKNWVFWINTNFGEASVSRVELQPSDVVTWRYSDKKPRF
ncbi:MAG: DUF4430 domain-containing protein [Phycisphaerae bacterium]